MKYIFTIICLMQYLSPVNSQVVLFDNTQGLPGFSPPPMVHAAHNMDLNFADLKEAPDSVQVNFPDGSTVVFTQTDFIPVSGYLFRDENDPPETPDFWPDPSASLADFSYKWSGKTAGYQTILTVHNGQMLGYINGSGKRYGIELRLDKSSYWIVDFNLLNFPARGINDTVNSVTNAKSKDAKKDSTYTSHLKSYDLTSNTNNTNNNLTSIKNGTGQIGIDMLILWQEEARIEAGGLAGDLNDTQGIDLLMVTAINHSNEALANSQTNTRVGRFHTAKLNGFSFSGQGFVVDVENFSELASVIQLRDLVSADVVAGIIESDFAAFQACGAAFAQTVPSTSFSPGAAFNNFAYSLTTQFCAIWDDTFAHELGHNLGANHTQIEMGPFAVAAISDAGFPDAFGWISGDFYSIMSISSTPDRVLNFSAPSVLVDGIATGVLNEANNARVIDQLSPAMAIFRINPDVVFENGFE